MKILKEGKLKHHLFTCPDCNCVFAANQKEFTTKISKQFIGTDTMRMCDVYKATFTATATCPCCEHTVDDHYSTQGTNSYLSKEFIDFIYNCDENGNTFNYIVLK